MKYLTIIDCLLDNIDEALKYVEMMSEYCVYSKKVYSAFLKIIKFGEKEILSDDKEESRKYIGSIFELLSMLIKAGFYDEFEKSLQLLNLIDNDEVLILLAKLYYENKAYSLAIEEFKRSIKIFDKIDLESLEMMKKSYLALL